jgi:negative regulator of flagellin synthesis FlgM
MSSDINSMSLQFLQMYAQTATNTQRRDPLSTDARLPRGQEIPASIELSPQAKQLNALEQQIHALPEVNQQRVDAIKQALEAGTYDIHPDKIASKILDNQI